MKALAEFIFMMVLVVSFVVPTYAQEALWKELNEQGVALYQQGRYSEAVNVAERALKVAESTFGADHPHVATSLNNLALLYNSQGKYAQAEPLYQRALAIWEKALGPDHPDVATVLENMAELYQRMEKKDEARRLEDRATGIRSRSR